MELSTLWIRVTVGLTLALVGGCAATLPAEPDVNFAAHTTDDGVVIDRMGSGQSAMLAPGDSSLFSNGPAFVLRSGGKTIASLWPTSTGFVVRTTVEQSASPIGQVDTSWDQGAILLALRPVGAGAFHTGTFRRISGSEVPEALGQPADTTLNVRGTYRAEILDAQGMPAGWLRVRISSFRVPARLYDGVVPDSLNGPLTVAAVARLDAAIDAVEAQALDPFIGN